MKYDLIRDTYCIAEVYKNLRRPLPPPSTFALRLIEEAVELCLAAGASMQDVGDAVQKALANEMGKNPSVKPRDVAPVDHDNLTGELADVGLQLSLTHFSSGISEQAFHDAADFKTNRLLESARAGLLYMDAIGRFYRRQSPYQRPIPSEA